MTPDEFETMTAATAELLGEGWSDAPTPYYDRRTRYLLGPDGAKLSVAFDVYRADDKFVVSGWYPEGDGDLPDSGKHFSIKVGLTRGSAVLAREIQRRLLPDYLPELARVQARIAERAAKVASVGVLAGELATLIDGRVHVQGMSANVSAYHGGASIDVAASLGGCNVKLSWLTAAQTHAVLAALKATPRESQ